ncbi:T9SS type A sorting domain-containing protein [Hymenobacter sp. RP-2-7]|uniref:endo-1,4-beta-xylanase n=1 Tax=Hymenobacter polaris TaxID=2682546 RepID=A0A7Y0AFY1_9BACT|nr:endo-1,4-beta-xylanase [Hymenobacter polaris]NML66380.1 T9SS type A sorting domain-containing protein [Hymenobacter polaris]
MKKPRRILYALVAALGSHFTLSAQNAPVVVEAETGTSTNPATPVTGATTGDWAVRTAAASGGAPAVTYITCLTDVAGYTSPTSPGGGVGGAAPATAARVLSFTVTFPGPGTYDLYAKVRVGSGGANDDSFFYGNSLGAKGPTTTTDWTTANGFYNAGYATGSGNVLVDGGGGAATGVWKWIDMSKFLTYGTAGNTFTVAAGALTQTFQIGAREDGLDFDKFVFGQTGLYFTVANLDAGTQGSTTAPVQFVPPGPPLATGKPKYLGCVYTDNEVPNFAKYWNSVTPGNSGKWGSVEGTRGTFNWTDLDAAYNMAVTVNGPFRMHNMIWGAQQPTWIKGLADTTQLREIKKWYAAVATHFAGKRLDYIDVVNEPINTPPTGFTTIGVPGTPAGTAVADGGGYINALGGTGATGYDWIITSYQLARQYFPASKLVLNEYSLVNSSARTATFVTIVNLLKSRGLIDGIGIQGHAFSTGGTPAATINANLATLAATGVPLYVTEYDSDALDANGVSNDAVQLAEYQRVFPLFWENPNVKGVTLWGARVGHWRTAQGDNIINADGTERPALVWLRNYVQSTALGTQAASAASAGVFLYPNPAQDGSVSLSLPPSLGAQAVEVALFNNLGQLVLRQTLAAQPDAVRTLGLPGVAKGMYTVRLQTGTQAYSQRLTVN